MPGAAAGAWAGPGGINPSAGVTNHTHGVAGGLSLWTAPCDLPRWPKWDPICGQCSRGCSREQILAMSPSSSHGPLLHSSRTFSMWKLRAWQARWPSALPSTWLPICKWEGQLTHKGGLSARVGAEGQLIRLCHHCGGAGVGDSSAVAAWKVQTAAHVSCPKRTKTSVIRRKATVQREQHFVFPAKQQRDPGPSTLLLAACPLPSCGLHVGSHRGCLLLAGGWSLLPESNRDDLIHDWLPSCSQGEGGRLRVPSTWPGVPHGSRSSAGLPRASFPRARPYLAV